MAIIYSYPIITSLTNDDRLIISDMDSATGNPTKSVTLSTLATFLGVSQTGGPFVPYVDGNGKRITRTEDTNKNTSLGFEALASLTTGTGNVAMGYNAGKVLDTGLNNVILGNDAGVAATDADLNVLIGKDAGKAVTIGNSNVVIGNGAGLALTTQSSNVCIGKFAGNDLITDDTCCVGQSAGSKFTTGIHNTFLGNQAGSLTVATASNTFVGYSAGNAQQGSTNTFVGALAGYGDLGGLSTGTRNVGVGQQSLNNVQSSFNTAIGFDSGSTITTGTYNSCIGHAAEPTVATATGEFTLGDSNVAVLRCQQTTITALSDQRDKTGIEDLPYGLDFINSLQPRKFVWDNRAEVDSDGNEYFSLNKGKKDIGFIAQELQTVDDEWLNLVYDSNPERLEASYGKLIPVLVKAIKELKARVEALES